MNLGTLQHRDPYEGLIHSRIYLWDSLLSSNTSSRLHCNLSSDWIQLSLASTNSTTHSTTMSPVRFCTITNTTWPSHSHTHPFNGPLSGTSRVSQYKKGKTNQDFTEARGSGISWAICKSAPRSIQITTPAPHHSAFCRQDALPAAQPTASKHWQNLARIWDIWDIHQVIFVSSIEATSATSTTGCHFWAWCSITNSGWVNVLQQTS